MNIRKFTLVTSIVISVFLFVSGVIMLSNFSSSLPGKNENGEEKRSAFSELFGGMVNETKPVNILLLGGDKVNGNTDTIMLINFDPNTTKANIVSIPRDTKVYIEGKARKINYAYPHGGAKLAVETVSAYFGVNIKYYIYIDTSVFRKIIDELGGVKNFNIPEDMNYDDDVQNLHIHLKKGIQDLDGDKAEQFMRFRKYNRTRDTINSENYDGSDIKRIEAQHRLIKELVRQKTSLLYFNKFDEVVNEIFYNLETNMLMSDILGLAQNLGQFNSDNFTFYTLPGVDGYENEVSYFLCDRSGAEELTRLYFQADEGFAGSEDIIDSYKKSIIQEAEPETENSKVKKDSSKTNTTKKNPSNNQTNIKKEQEPEP